MGKKDNSKERDVVKGIIKRLEQGIGIGAPADGNEILLESLLDDMPANKNKGNK